MNENFFTLVIIYNYEFDHIKSISQRKLNLAKDFLQIRLFLNYVRADTRAAMRLNWKYSDCSYKRNVSQRDCIKFFKIISFIRTKHYIYFQLSLIAARVKLNWKQSACSYKRNASKKFNAIAFISIVADARCNETQLEI